MKNRIATIGIGLIGAGLILNFLDAYYSGNLPFSPSTSDQNNSVSKLNRIGQAVGSVKITLGVIIALSGAFLILGKLAGFIGRKSH